jgi:hypothetical protein
MELDELRQRLLLRSKSAEIPPVANPVQPGGAGYSASVEAKPPTAVSANPATNGHKQEAPGGNGNGNGNRAEVSPAPIKIVEKETQSERPMNNVPVKGKSPALSVASAQAEPIAILASTVDQLFEPTEAFRQHFAQLSRLLAPIDSATHSSEEALKRITGLHAHLSSLADTFQSVKAFADQVRTMSATFEPMKALNDQLSQLIEAFYLNVKELATALEPVTSLQSKLRQLAATLDPINQLETQILELAEAFSPTPDAPAQRTGTR